MRLLSANQMFGVKLIRNVVWHNETIFQKIPVTEWVLVFIMKSSLGIWRGCESLCFNNNSIWNSNIICTCLHVFAYSHTSKGMFYIKVGIHTIYLVLRGQVGNVTCGVHTHTHKFQMIFVLVPCYNKSHFNLYISLHFAKRLQMEIIPISKFKVKLRLVSLLENELY